MTSPIGTVQGLASGIQWQTMIQQIVAADSTRELNARHHAADGRHERKRGVDEVPDRDGLVPDRRRALADPAAFDLFTATAPNSASSQRALVSATATTGAQPGTYAMQVLSLASAESLSGASFSSATSPLNISGQFDLNGVAITVASTDSLSSIADKINAADAGTTPSGVQATILSGTDGSHLVLTSDVEPARRASRPWTTRTARSSALGFTDGTAVANIAASGATQTFAMSSATQSIGSLLGLTPPAATSILVGGKSIAVDLGSDSLTSIAAKINAATGNPNAASVQTQTIGSTTTYRLVTDSTVETDPPRTPPTAPARSRCSASPSPAPAASHRSCRAPTPLPTRTPAPARPRARCSRTSR